MYVLICLRQHMNLTGQLRKPQPNAPAALLHHLLRPAQNCMAHQEVRCSHPGSKGEGVIVGVSVGVGVREGRAGRVERSCR